MKQKSAAPIRDCREKKILALLSVMQLPARQIRMANLPAQTGV